MANFREIFGSISVKISFILIVMAGFVASSIFISSSVFKETVSSLEMLNGSHLNELETVSETIHHVNDLKTVLLRIVAASDVDNLRKYHEEATHHLSVLEGLIETEMGKDRGALSDLLTRVNRDMNSLLKAKTAEFERTALFAQKTNHVRDLAVRIRTQLAEQHDRTFQSLTRGKNQTVDEVDETLRFLIDDVVHALTLRFEISGDMNLAAGIALTLSQTTDLNLIEDLRTALKNYIGHLEKHVGALGEATYGSFETEYLRSAIALFKDVLKSNSFIVNLRRAEIFEVREKAVQLLDDQIVEFTAILAVESKRASGKNRNAIQFLLDGSVKEIRNLSALETAVWSMMNVVLTVATAQDYQSVDKLAGTMQESVDALLQIENHGDDQSLELVSDFLSYGDSTTGIVSDRIAVISARNSATEAKESAVASVLEIGKTIARIGAQAHENIYSESLLVLKDAHGAMVRLSQIGWISVAVVIGALTLTYFWIARPMRRLTSVTERLAAGHLEENVAFTDQAGEIGRMAKALNVFRDGLVEKDQLQKMESDERKNRIAEQALIVSSLAEAMNRLADGDLDAQIATQFPGEYDRLRADFNAATANLRGIVQKIARSGNSVNDSSNEISKASDELARRTESSAATLAETAAAISQMTEAVQSAADRAENALDVVGMASESAHEGKEVVGSTVAAIRQIEESSDKIRTIISVIDDISFQTNLLALNAGVEAARAGEAGRGFAVVASEVRGLAQRSSDAAREINSLISDSSMQVVQGVELVEKTERALTQIETAVIEVSEQAREIAASAKQQAIGVAEVNTAIDELDQDTQKNAAMFEQTSAASLNLHSEAENLANAISGLSFSNADEIEEHVSSSVEDHEFSDCAQTVHHDEGAERDVA